MSEYMVTLVGPIPVDRDRVIVTAAAKTALLCEGWTPPKRFGGGSIHDLIAAGCFVIEEGI